LRDDDGIDGIGIEIRLDEELDAFPMDGHAQNAGKMAA